MPRRAGLLKREGPVTVSHRLCSAVFGVARAVRQQRAARGDVIVIIRELKKKGF